MKLFLSLSLVLLSLNAFSDIVKPLAASDELGKTTKAINTRLGDNNISSGGSNPIWAGQLKSTDMDLESLTAEGFLQAYKQNSGEALPKDAVIKIKVGKFKDGDGKTGTVTKMVKGLLEANDYTPSQESFEANARYIWVVLRKLPVSSDTVVGEVETTVINSIGDKATVRYFLLINKDQKAVQFLTIQGHM